MIPLTHLLLDLLVREEKPWKMCNFALRILKIGHIHPGWIAQLVRASSRYAKVADSVPGQGTYKNQPMNAYISGTTN